MAIEALLGAAIYKTLFTLVSQVSVPFCQIVSVTIKKYIVWTLQVVQIYFKDMAFKSLMAPFALRLKNYKLMLINGLIIN